MKTQINKQEEIARLQAWAGADPENPEIRRIVDDAIANGKSEDDVRGQLLRAMVPPMTQEDHEAAKLVRLSPAEYRKGVTRMPR